MTSRKTLTTSLLLAVILFTACNKSPKNAYSIAVKGEDDYANVVGVLITTDKDLLANKQIDVNEFRIIMQAAAELNVYGSAFADTVDKLHNDATANAFDYLNAANIIVNEVQNLNINQALHLKNPQAQAALNVALQGISLFLSKASAEIAAALPPSTLPPTAPIVNPPPATSTNTPTDPKTPAPTTPTTPGGSK